MIGREAGTPPARGWESAESGEPIPHGRVALTYRYVQAPPPHLPGILRSLEPTLDRFGYLAVAALVMVEDFGVPLPGETILVLAAVYAGTGRLNVFLVALIGFLAAVTGDSIGYAIGRFGGRAVVERFGRYVLLTPERLDSATRFYERQGPKVVTVARFVEGLRQANGIIAGMAGMPWLRFLAYNALGAALWVGVWTSVGYFSGSHITEIYNDAKRYETYFAIAAAAVIVFLIGRAVTRRMRRRDRREPTEDGGGDSR